MRWLACLVLTACAADMRVVTVHVEHDPTLAIDRLILKGDDWPPVTVRPGTRVQLPVNTGVVSAEAFLGDELRAVGSTVIEGSEGHVVLAPPAAVVLR